MSEARARYKEGVEHYAAGRTDDAVASYRQALEINGKMAMAWNGLAMALAKAGDLDATHSDGATIGVWTDSVSNISAAAEGNPEGADGLADIPDGQLDLVVESAEECPGECIFIEP